VVLVVQTQHPVRVLLEGMVVLAVVVVEMVRRSEELETHQTHLLLKETMAVVLLLRRVTVVVVGRLRLVLMALEAQGQQAMVVTERHQVFLVLL